jgi:tetratricopeptide (TPR) repeat protein
VEYGSSLILNINDRAKASLKDGEALMKVGDYEGALNAFQKACSYFPVSANLEQATINERMGDLYSKVEHEASWEFRWAENDKAPYDQAAHCYERAIVEYINAEEISNALRVLGKLFNHLVPEEIGLAYAIRAYLDILDKIPSDMMERFAEEAVSALTSLQRWSEAGDLMLDTGNYIAYKTHNKDVKELERFYRRAEDLYERCSYVEQAEGISRLVQGYYRIGHFDEVIRCFIRMLNLYQQADDIARYVSVLGQVKLFKDDLDMHDLNTISKNLKSILNELSESSEYFWDLHMTASWFLDTIISKVPDQSDTKQRPKTQHRFDQEKKIEYGEQAREHLELCMEFAVTNGQLSSALNSDGLMLSRFGALDSAQDKFNRAIAIMKHIGDDLGLAIVYANMAGLLQKNRRFEDASNLLWKSIDIWERWNERRYNHLLIQQEKPLTESEVAEIQWGKKSFASALTQLGSLLLQRFNDIEGLHMIERAKRIKEEAVSGKVLPKTNLPVLRHSLGIGEIDYD